MMTRYARLLAGFALAAGVLAGCGGDSGNDREASAGDEADTITVECFWTMRSGDEPVIWERDLPKGDAAAYAKAEEDCVKEQASAQLRTVA